MTKPAAEEKPKEEVVQVPQKPEQLAAINDIEQEKLKILHDRELQKKEKELETIKKIKANLEKEN